MISDIQDWYQRQKFSLWDLCSGKGKYNISFQVMSVAPRKWKLSLAQKISKRFLKLSVLPQYSMVNQFKSLKLPVFETQRIWIIFGNRNDELKRSLYLSFRGFICWSKSKLIFPGAKVINFLERTIVRFFRKLIFKKFGGEPFELRLTWNAYADANGLDVSC